MRSFTPWLLIALCLAAPPAGANELARPEFVDRLARIMDQATEDLEGTLATLNDLARPGKLRRARERAMVERERAALLVELDRPREAARLLGAFLRAQPDDFAPALYLMLGQIHLAADDNAAALEAFQTWVAATEKPAAFGLFFLGYAYAQAERFEDAAAALERAVADERKVRNEWLEMLAYVYTRLGRSEEAVALIEDLIEKRPGQLRWWRQLATVYLLQDKVRRGAAVHAAMAALEPLDAAQKRRLARLYGYLGMPREAAALLRETMEAAGQPATRDERMLHVSLLVLAREFEQAEALLGAMLGDGGDGEAGVLLGQLYLQRERYDDARLALNEALKAFGVQAPAEAWYLLAVAEINLGNIDAAADAVALIEDDPDFARRAARLRGTIASLARGG